MAENLCKLSVTVPRFTVGFYPIKEEFFINYCIFKVQRSPLHLIFKLSLRIRLCWGLTTCQPLCVILCRLPEKARKEIVEEMKERDREKREQEWKWRNKKLEMWQWHRCLRPGPSSPTHRHFAKNEVDKRARTLMIIGRFYPKSNLSYILWLYTCV